MTKPMESGVLDLLDKVLGLAKGGAQVTQLDESNVSTVLDILPDIARRSRTLGGSTGWFYGLLRVNLTNASQTQIAVIDPYSTGTFVPPWIDPLPSHFEIWLEMASVRLTLAGGAVAGDFTAATLLLDPTANDQAFGVDEVGGAVLSNPAFPVARWTAADVTRTEYAVDAQGLPMQRLGIRLKRGVEVNFEATASLAVGETITADCVLLIGAFPVTLGSDVAK